MTASNRIATGVAVAGALGCYADLIVFEPATVIDRATFEAPHQLSAGIEHVWANGTAMVSEGKPTGAKPGRALRGRGWTGRRR